MEGPRLNGTRDGVCIPELCLQQLASWRVEAACVLCGSIMAAQWTSIGADIRRSSQDTWCKECRAHSELRDRTDRGDCVLHVGDWKMLKACSEREPAGQRFKSSMMSSRAAGRSSQVGRMVSSG